MVLLPLVVPDLGREGPALLLLMLEVGRAGQEGGDLVIGLLLRRGVGVPDEVVLEQRLRRVRRAPGLEGGGLKWRPILKSNGCIFNLSSLLQKLPCG